MRVKKSESVSHLVVCLFEILWTVARQAPLFMGFSRQEYWSGLPFPSPGHLPDPVIEPGSPTLQADFFTVLDFGLLLKAFQVCLVKFPQAYYGRRKHWENM